MDFEDISVTELYQLENGNVYITLESEEKISWPYQGIFLPEEDEYYGIAAFDYSWWSDCVEQYGTIHSVSYVFPAKKLKTPTSNEADAWELSAIYYKDHDDERILLWEENMEIEEAPSYIEKKVAEFVEMDEQCEFSIFNWE